MRGKEGGREAESENGSAVASHLPTWPDRMSAARLDSLCNVSPSATGLLMLSFQNRLLHILLLDMINF